MIYDVVGVDMLDFFGWDILVIIDLLLGSYFFVNGMINNIGIVFGIEIENVIGGGGDDILCGLDGDNMFSGGVGLDCLIGVGGVDIYVLLDFDVVDIIMDFEVGIDWLDI